MYANKLTGTATVELSDMLVNELGIDTSRYKLVRIETYPNFALFCIDLMQSDMDKEWLVKFDAHSIDINKLSDLFETIQLNVAIHKKYLDLEADKKDKLDFDDAED